MSLVISFYFIGALMLLYNTIRDFQKQMIDDRFNYLAMGSVLMIMSYYKIGFLLFLELLIISIIIQITGKKLLANGDFSALNWIIFGFGSIGVFKLAMFLLFFICFTFAYIMILKTHNIKKAPFYFVILISFIVGIFA